MYSRNHLLLRSWQAGGGALTTCLLFWFLTACNPKQIPAPVPANAEFDLQVTDRISLSSFHYAKYRLNGQRAATVALWVGEKPVSAVPMKPATNSHLCDILVIIDNPSDHTSFFTAFKPAQGGAMSSVSRYTNHIECDLLKSIKRSPSLAEAVLLGTFDKKEVRLKLTESKE